MIDQSAELCRYLALEQRLYNEPDQFLADDLRDRMDLLWFEMTKNEREWINNRGEMKSCNAKTTSPTAMLLINGSSVTEAATDAVLKVIAAKAASEVTTEALRTLAVIGKPPREVNVSNCTFTAERRGKV